MRASCPFLSERTHRLFETFQVRQKSATILAYAAEISSVCSFFSCDFLALTPDMCEAYLTYLNGKVESGELKTSTVTKKFHQLSSFARFVSLQGIGFLNPFAGLFVEEAKEEIPPASIVSFDALDAVIGVLLEKRDYPTYFAVLMSLKLMLRISEFRLLKFHSFVFDESTSSCVVRVQSESGDVRYVKVPDDLYRLIESFHTTRDEFIMSRTGLKPENSRWLQRHLKEACEEAGVSSFNYQDLRNTGIYTAGRNGIFVGDLQEQLGHKSSRHIERLTSIGVRPLAATDFVNIYIGDVFNDETG